MASHGSGSPGTPESTLPALNIPVWSYVGQDSLAVRVPRCVETTRAPRTVDPHSHLCGHTETFPRRNRESDYFITNRLAKSACKPARNIENFHFNRTTPLALPLTRPLYVHLFCTRYHSRTMNITLFTAMTMYVLFRAQIVRVVSRWLRLTGWPQKCAAVQAPSHPPAQRNMDHTPPSFSRFSPFSGSAVRGYAQCRYSSAVSTSAPTSFIQRPIVITSAIVSLKFSDGCGLDRELSYSEYSE